MSLGIVLGAPGKIVVAADSRAMACHDGNRSTKVLSDSYKKLFRCGERSVCMVMGWLGDVGSYSVSQQVEAICNSTDLADHPARILEAIRTEIDGPVSGIPPDLLPKDAPLVISVMVLRLAPDGALDFFELRYQSVDERQPEIIRHLEGVRLDRRFRFCSGCATTITHELAEALDPRTMGDALIAQRVRKIFEASQLAEHGSEIGGPTVIACLGLSGFRWLQ